jgi:hypothetical protein
MNNQTIQWPILIAFDSFLMNVCFSVTKKNAFIYGVEIRGLRQRATGGGRRAEGRRNKQISYSLKPSAFSL